MTSKRNIAAILGGVAAVALFLIVNPWVAVDPKSTADQIVTVVFWVSFIALLVVLFEMRKEPGGETVEIEGPAFTRFLFGNTRAGLFWLPIRLFVGLHLARGRLSQVQRHRLDGRRRSAPGLLAARRRDPGAGAGSPAITFEWYRALPPDPPRQQRLHLVRARSSPSVRWPSGIGLIVGCLTGIAAFFGALMNMSFLLAGSASINPVLFTLAIGLILGWKVAGYYGVDRYLLPMLGTPWHPGAIKGRETKPVGGAQAI